MDKLTAEVGQSFYDDYRKATESNQTDALYQEALLAMALAKTDEEGFFTPASVINPYSTILGRKITHAHFQRHLNEFISNERGPILTRRGRGRRFKYRFADPMMQPYVIIKGIRDNMIPEEMKAILSSPEQPSLAIEP
jgi:hypothetical protein